MNIKQAVRTAAASGMLAAAMGAGAPVQAKEWAFDLAMDMTVALPDFEIAVPTLPELPKDRCEKAERAINVLESSVLEIGAKYWASRLKSKDFDIRTLTKNPGSDIIDDELRARFYERLTFHHAGDSSEPNMFELERLAQAKAKIEKIVDLCS